MPLGTPARNLPSHALTNTIPIPTLLSTLLRRNIHAHAAKPTHKVEVLVAAQTERDEVDPRPQPLGVPLAKDGHLVREAAALQEAVEAA